MARTYDAIVIGGGVIGASIAFHLAKARVGRVALVERRTICSGNTRKSGAIVRMHYSNDPEARLALASLPYFQHWSEMVGGTAASVQPDSRCWSGRRTSNAWGATSRGCRRLGWTPVAWPAPRMPAEDHAVRSRPRCGRCRLRACQRLRRRRRDDPLVGRGGRDGSAPRSWKGRRSRRSEHRRARHWRVPPTRRLEAPIVVCAANTWSPALLQTVGVDLPVTPRRAQTAYFERPTSLHRAAPGGPGHHNRHVHARARRRPAPRRRGQRDRRHSSRPGRATTRRPIQASPARCLADGRAGADPGAALRWHVPRLACTT